MSITIGAFVIYKQFSDSGEEAVLESEKATLPSPLQVQKSPQPSGVQETSNSQQQIPSELNLEVPFTSQAPHANWDHTHEEACEEAAILIASRYYRGQGFENADDAEQALQEIIAWEKENLGFFESTTAQETARVAREMLGLNTQVIENPTVEGIKKYIFENKLVLVPAAGRELGNPFFTAPGPLYHMLVVKGYTQTQFITNDPGTRRGENYPYEFETILNANHDWNRGDVGNGAKVMIVVGQ